MRTRDAMNYKAWSACLLRAYKGLEAAVDNNNTTSVRCVLACSQTTMPASHTGLERWVLTTVARRRNAAWGQILKHVQACHYADNADRMRAASRSVSRPAAWYAHYLAVLSARELTNHSSL